jgi:RNA polymerase sigma factor (sigma-70 family)
MSQQKRNATNVLLAREGIRARNELLICQKGLLETLADCKLLLEAPDSFWDAIDVSGRERVVVKNMIGDILSVATETLGEWTMLALDHPELETSLYVRLRGFVHASRDHGELVQRNVEALEDKIAKGDAARDRLVRENSGLIHKVLRPYLGDEDLVEELSSVCREEMMTCIDRTFDPTRKLAFSTYVTHCMRSKCIEAAGKWNAPYHIPNAKLKERGELLRGEKDVEGDVYSKLTLLNSSSYLYFDDVDQEELETVLGDDDFEAVESRMAWESMANEVLDHMVEEAKDEQSRQRWELRKRVLELRGIFNLEVAEEPARFEEISQILYEEGYTDTPVTHERVRQYLSEAIKKFGQVWRKQHEEPVEKSA